MLASSSDFGDVLQRDNCSTQCERSDETLVLASFLCADSVIQGGHRSREVCGVGEHWNETHGRLFNDNPKCEGREAGFCERLCKSDGALSLVELAACPVLTRSCFRVDAQQLVAVDLDSRMRRSLWISGANVNEEMYPQVLTRRFLDEEERRNICRHKNSFTGLISVYREDGVCCVFTLSPNLALFNLIVAINKRAVNVFPPPQR